MKAVNPYYEAGEKDGLGGKSCRPWPGCSRWSYEAGWETGIAQIRMQIELPLREIDDDQC